MSASGAHGLAHAHDDALAQALDAARAPSVTPARPVGACFESAAGDRVVGRSDDDDCCLEHARRAAEARGLSLRGGRVAVTSLVLEPAEHLARAAGALAASGVRSVVVGAAGPGTSAHDDGVAVLVRAGLEVSVLDPTVPSSAACRAHLERFVASAASARPWVTAKAALSLDGRLAADDGGSTWITGASARAHGHALRAASEAVLVGVGTALADDPQLTVRDAPGRSPLRVVLDRALRLPRSAALVRTAREVPTLVFHAADADAGVRAEFAAAGVALHVVPVVAGRLDLAACLRTLRAFGVVRLLVEGGATLLRALFSARFVDALSFAYAPVLLGGAGRHTLSDLGFGGTMAEAARLEEAVVHTLGADVVVEGTLPLAWRSSCSPG